MISKIAKIPVKEFLLLTYTLFLSAKIRFYTKFIPIKTILSKTSSSQQDRPLNQDEQDYFQAVRRSIYRSHHRVPWRMKCLEQGLVAKQILNKKKIPSTLFLGIKKKGEEYDLHAWLQCGDRYLRDKGNGYVITKVIK